MDGRAIGATRDDLYFQAVKESLQISSPTCAGRLIEVEVRRSFAGHVVFRSVPGAKNHDYRTVEYRTNVLPGKKADLRCEIVQHQGRNYKQDNATIVEVK